MSALKSSNIVLDHYVRDTALSFCVFMMVLVYFPTIMIILLLNYTNVINFKISLILALLFFLFDLLLIFSIYRVIQNLWMARKLLY
jgi:hypothetical protein